MNYTTIYTTPDSSEVAIIKNLLAEHEIHYQVPDEFTDKALGIAGLGINGMRVQVLEEQKDKAIAILRGRGFFI